MRNKFLTMRKTLPVILTVLLALCLTFGVILLKGKGSAQGNADASVWDGDLEKAGWADTEGSAAPAPDTYVFNAENKTLEIGSAEAFAYFAHQVFADESYALDGVNVKLVCDIDLGGDANIWIPIGTAKRSDSDKRFSGTFDGNGHTVYNLTSTAFFDNISYDAGYGEAEGYYLDCGDGLKVPFYTENGEFCYGLFAVTSNITVKNLTVSGVKFELSDKSVNGADVTVGDVGALIGCNEGSLNVENCVIGSVNGDNGDDGSITVYTDGDSAVGGIIGGAYAGETGVTDENLFENIIVERCVNNVSVSFASAADEGSVSGKTSGIIGYADRFKDFKLTDCKNYGKVNGDNFTGGILGYFRPGETGVNEITECYNYGDVTGGLSENLEIYTPVTGGFIGWLDYSGEDNDSGTAAEREINLTITGGNCGKVHGDEASGTVSGLIGKNTYPAKPVKLISLTDACGVAVTEEAASVSVLKAGRTTAELIYDENDNTVIKGINVNGTDGFEIEIPSEVTKIDFAAFRGVKNLTGIKFAKEGALTEICDWAFAGTGITEIEIPAKVKKIGAAAFGDCANLVSVGFAGDKVTYIGKSAFGNCPELNKVELPANAAEIVYGEYVFDKQHGDGSPAYLIAKDRERFDALSSALTDNAANLAVYTETITYPVTIYYYRDTVKLGEELRLCNIDYKVKLVDGKWITTDTDKVGSSGLTDLRWYYDAKLIDVDGASELLTGTDSLGDYITFYTFDDNGEKYFIARDDIVYDENSAYETTDLNDLLSADSSKIENGMAVEITGYETPDGVTGEFTGYIHNAGLYTIKITFGTEVYELKLTVKRQIVNLGDYNKLSWKVQGEDGNADLNGMTLYIYSKDGREYPSNAVLTNEQIDALGVSRTYKTRQVLYSAVRYSGSPVTLCVENNSAYDVEYPHGMSTYTNVGTYESTAILTLKDNYLFENSSASALRGLDIKFNGDGTVTVKKTWYIVNINNWLVNESGAEYTIQNFIYGNNPGVSAPLLKFNNYDPDAPLTFYLELQFNGATVGTRFTPDEIGDYINKTMPAGDYKLIVTVGEVTSKEWDEEKDPAHEYEPTVIVYHAGFTESRVFTVEKKGLQSLTAFDTALKGQVFYYEWDGKSHFYEQSETVKTAYSSFLSKFYLPARLGVWADAKYGDYYGAPVVTYNLDRMQSAEYHSAETVFTGDADTYTVYYKVSAPNYYDSLERLSGGSRKDYYFKVINVKEIALPSVGGKTFNGNVLTADTFVPSDDEGKPLYYSVKTNEGGRNAGEYDVVFSLIDSEHYMWAGQTLDDRTEDITVKFTINKSADNYFTTTLNITTWVVGKYAELEEFPVSAAANFGKVIITLSYSDDIENVIYSGENNTEEFAKALSGLKAGSYIMTASVADSEDFNGITGVITFRVFDKDGLPWWAVVLIVAGALGVVAAVFFILHQKGVLQMLTGRFVIAMRARATVDATIAAVRANKVAAEAKKSVAKAEEEDRLAELKANQSRAENSDKRPEDENK